MVSKITVFAFLYSLQSSILKKLTLTHSVPSSVKFQSFLLVLSSGEEIKLAPVNQNHWGS
jgi:hypothetical protein